MSEHYTPPRASLNGAPFWIPERVERLKEMRNAGATDLMISEEFGVTRETVKSKRQRLGLKRVSDQPNHFSFWIQTRLARLRELFALGVSNTLIAKDMGITRGSVAGKLARLGLTRDVKPPPVPKSLRSTSPVGHGVIQAIKSKIERQLKPSPLTGGVFNRPSISAHNPMERVRDLPQEAGGVTFADLKPDGCRWPVSGDARDGTLRFCRCTQLSTGSYCARHERQSRA